ncbi:MAG: hypothetical protein E6614_31350, partial [Bradyrhizobium sp.]|nr:hypothetical protein [Bradyrhizobium sp.]
ADHQHLAGLPLQLDRPGRQILSRLGSVSSLLRKAPVNPGLFVLCPKAAGHPPPWPLASSSQIFTKMTAAASSML